MPFHASFHGNPVPLAVFAIIGASIAILSVKAGAWHSLARRYCFRGKFTGHAIDPQKGVPLPLYVLWCDGLVGGKQKQDLIIKTMANRDGLYLRRFGVLAWLRSSLFIPWHDISDEWYEPNFLGIELTKTMTSASKADCRAVLLKFDKVHNVQLQIPLSIAQEIKSYDQGQWKSNCINVQENI